MSLLEITKGVQIEIDGVPALITNVEECCSGLKVMIEFVQSLKGLRRLPVTLPPQEYTKEEGLNLIRQEAKEKLIDLKKQLKREENYQREKQHFHKLAQELKRKIGLDKSVVVKSQ